MDDAREDLHRYLQEGREALLWKLEGVSEHDARRPLTPTGTNLLGLVKHVASVESEYLGLVFRRPFPEELPWSADGAERDADLWALPDERREDVVALYRRVWAHGDATVAALPLDAEGSVPWWPEGRRTVTLHRVLVHLVAETHRHAGHADVVRELVDGAAGLSPRDDNLARSGADAWRAHHDRVERAAREAAGLPGRPPEGR
jgi:uncharacterized damage-inducible protein DinB